MKIEVVCLEKNIFQRCRLFIYQLVILFAASIFSPHTVSAQLNDTKCTLPADDVKWMQTALDIWQHAVDDFLLLPSEPLPWIIFFDKSCVWHLAPDRRMITDAISIDPQLRYRGEPVRVLYQRHGGEIQLPNGKDIPVGVVSSTMLYNGDTKPFFVVAMPSIWAEIPGLADAMDPAGFVLGLISHELVHTRHLVDVARHVELDLREKYELPEDMDDNVVDNHFESAPGFVQATRSERDLLYRAVAADIDSVRTDLVRRALALVQDRRERYFINEDTVYGELEDIFLAMEGVAVWTHYKLSQNNPAVFFRRSENPERMQDEGFVLFLLLEEMVPDWRTRVFAPIPASPFQMLREAVETN